MANDVDHYYGIYGLCAGAAAGVAVIIIAHCRMWIRERRPVTRCRANDLAQSRPPLHANPGAGITPLLPTHLHSGWPEQPWAQGISAVLAALPSAPGQLRDYGDMFPSPPGAPPSYPGSPLTNSAPNGYLDPPPAYTSGNISEHLHIDLIGESGSARGLSHGGATTSVGENMDAQLAAGVSGAASLPRATPASMAGRVFWRRDEADMVHALDFSFV